MSKNTEDTLWNHYQQLVAAHKKWQEAKANNDAQGQAVAIAEGQEIVERDEMAGFLESMFGDDLTEDEVQNIATA